MEGVPDHTLFLLLSDRRGDLVSRKVGPGSRQVTSRQVPSVSVPGDEVSRVETEGDWAGKEKGGLRSKPLETDDNRRPKPFVKGCRV